MTHGSRPARQPDARCSGTFTAVRRLGSATGHRRVGLRLLLALLLAAGACREDEPPRHFSVFSGTVQSVQVDAGGLTVRLTNAPGSTDAPANDLSCVVTRDSEIYVNDRCAGLAEIAPGDEVELIGHSDLNPRLERFMVSFAYVDHPLPPAPIPELMPETRPAAEDHAQQEP